MHTVWKSWGFCQILGGRVYRGCENLGGRLHLLAFYCIFINKFGKKFGGRVHFNPPSPPYPPPPPVCIYVTCLKNSEFFNILSLGIEVLSCCSSGITRKVSSWQAFGKSSIPSSDFLTTLLTYSESKSKLQAMITKESTVSGGMSLSSRYLSLSLNSLFSFSSRTCGIWRGLKKQQCYYIGSFWIGHINFYCTTLIVIVRFGHVTPIWNQ